MQPSWKNIEQILDFKALLSTYGVMMLTSTAVASNPESSNEPIPHNKLLINMTVQSVQQIRRRLEWNLENEAANSAAKATLVCAGPNYRVSR